jgi:hypothetical protein
MAFLRADSDGTKTENIEELRTAGHFTLEGFNPILAGTDDINEV